MRQLNPEEKKLIEKQVKRLESELEYNAYLGEYAELMLTKGLTLNFRKQVREYEDKKKELNAERDTAQKTIAVLKEQLLHGVEEKRDGVEKR